MNETITLADGSVLDVARWPLPLGLDDSVLLNKTQLATAMRTSENTIAKWMTLGMPIEGQGANGVSYSFRLSHCFAWRMFRDEQARSEKSRSDNLAQQAAMAFLNLEADEADEIGSLSADEVRRRSIAEYERNKASELRRDLVRADQVLQLMEGLLTIVRTRVMAMPDYVEAEFGLTAVDTAKLQNYCDQTLTDMRVLIETDLTRPATVLPFGSAQAELSV